MNTIEIKKEICVVLVILSLSIATRFFILGYPSQVVFDETYYGKFSAGYLTNGNTFSGHPPLGALIITLGGWLGNLNNPNDFSKIGQDLHASAYLYMRFLVGLFGIFIPVLVYLMCRLLFFGRITAMFASLILVFENSLVVQSRFIMPDSILLFFGFGSLTLFLLGRVRKSVLIKTLAALLAGSALSVKWTGLSYIFIMVVLEMLDIIRKNYSTIENEAVVFVKRVMVGLVLPALLVYLLSFAIHFAILDKLSPSRFIQDTINENKSLIYANTHSSSHPAQSKWYEWPVMLKPVSYWVGSHGVWGRENIYFTGNLFVYILSTVAVLFGTLYVIVKNVKAILTRRSFSGKEKTLSFLVFAYWLNLLPFSFITRPMFLYHYLAALIFAVCILMFLIDSFVEKKFLRIFCYSIIVLTIANFLFTSPYTYGYRVRIESFHPRLWNSG